MSFPKTFDIYEFCTDELKKSLDLGRDFERRIREEEDQKALEGKTEGGDVVMKDESSKQQEEEKKQSAVIAKAKKREQE